MNDQRSLEDQLYDLEVELRTRPSLQILSTMLTRRRCKDPVPKDWTWLRKELREASVLCNKCGWYDAADWLALVAYHGTIG